MASYFRIQSADRDPRDLLNPENWFTSKWGDEDLIQAGVSVCDSRESLARYLAGTGIPFGLGEWNLIELAGDVRDERGHDAEYGEILINPTEIVAYAPLDDEFYALVSAAFDAIEASR